MSGNREINLGISCGFTGGNLFLSPFRLNGIGEKFYQGLPVQCQTGRNKRLWEYPRLKCKFCAKVRRIMLFKIQR